MFRVKLSTLSVFVDVFSPPWLDVFSCDSFFRNHPFTVCCLVKPVVQRSLLPTPPTFENEAQPLPRLQLEILILHIERPLVAIPNHPLLPQYQMLVICLKSPVSTTETPLPYSWVGALNPRQTVGRERTRRCVLNLTDKTQCTVCHIDTICF